MKRVAAIVWIVLAIGCGPRGPAVHKVEGEVRMGGKPLVTATVCFHPAGGGLPAAGMTDDAGRYAITAAAPHARPSGGTTVGEYTVTIERYEDWRDDFPPAPSDPEGFARWNEQMRVIVEKRSQQKPKLLTPEKYSKPESSPLKVTVKKGTNAGPEFSLDLR